MNSLKAALHWIDNTLKTKSGQRGEEMPDPPPPPSPNFFIVGAAKAGTTSLWQYLRQHPEIFMPERMSWKEPSYYCDTCGVGDHTLYLSLFEDAGTRKRVGEASTAYLSSPESPLRIREAVPDARIIIMLRNPVDRAYSLYRFMHSKGHETLTSFHAALEAEVQCRRNNPEFINQHSRKGSHIYFRDLLHFDSGLYCEQVKAFYACFPAEQILVVIFEEFVKHTLAVTREVYRFLDVAPNFTPEIKIHNQGVPGCGEFTENIRCELEQRYLSDVRNLSNFLNKDLESAWFKKAESS